MATEKYDLVFSGELARRADPAQSKKNLANLFKISAEKVEALFSGKPITLKKGLDFDTATKYRVAIKKAGCLVDLVEQKAAPVAKGKAVFGAAEAPAKKPAPEAKASQVKPSAAPAQAKPPTRVQPQVRPTASQSEARQAPKPTAPPQTAPPIQPNLKQSAGVNPSVSATGSPAKMRAQDIDSPDFGLSDVGEDLLKANEHEYVEPVTVDTSGVSLKSQSGDLLDDSEKTPFIPLDIEIDATLSPAGSDLIQPSERTTVTAVEVDISDMSMADVGADLEQLKDTRPLVKPDISGLSLE